MPDLDSRLLLIAAALFAALAGCGDSSHEVIDASIGDGHQAQSVSGVNDGVDTADGQTGSDNASTGSGGGEDGESMTGEGSDGPGTGGDIGVGDPGVPRMQMACSGGACDCPEGENCAFDCAEGGCQDEVKCNGGDCTAACPDGDCRLDCEAQGTCAYSCEGGGCEFSCDGASDCSVSCAGGGCQVDCDADSTCAVDCTTSGDPCVVTCEAGGMVDVCEGECESEGC